MLRFITKISVASQIGRMLLYSNTDELWTTNTWLLLVMLQNMQKVL